jgi:hypothetical protein
MMRYDATRMRLRDYGTGILSKVVDLYLLIFTESPGQNIGEMNGS